jgi:polyhydroxybutyrate depolymerase
VQVHKFTHGDSIREARIYVPPGWQAQALPLVVSFHAWASQALWQQVLDSFDYLAETEGFIVAYPEGLSLAKSGYIPIPMGEKLGARTFNAGGCCPFASEERTDDVGFARALINEIHEKFHPVDWERIYATGMSNGAFMSHRLGCQASDIFAAIGPVGGILKPSSKRMPWGTDPFTCEPSRPVPVLHFHGYLDPLVPVMGGGPALFAPVKTTIKRWRKFNKVADYPDYPKRRTYKTLLTTCHSWGPDEVNVTYCLSKDGSHAWPGKPGGGSQIDATAEIWAFFKRHTLTGRVTKTATIMASKSEDDF